ncbi:RNA-binding protein [Alphaproteobacteria bacterium]|nr:RNA-binding protein [Alphaproteobacteria bacterium]
MCCKIIVLNLPRDFTEDELQVLFEPHGEIISCDLVLDKNTGVSKGFGFIIMEHVSQADIAIKALHQTRLKKQKIRVKFATQD